MSAPTKQKAKTRTQRAVETGILAGSLINICRAAAGYAEEQEGFPTAKHIPADLARVLAHVELLVGECTGALELAAMREGLAQ